MLDKVKSFYSELFLRGYDKDKDVEVEKKLAFRSDVSEMLKKIFNQTRKSNLFQESQLKKTEELESKFSIQFEQFQALRNEWHNKGFFFREDDILFLFDQIGKMNETLSQDAAVFLSSTIVRLLTITGWNVVAQSNEIYDSLSMEVVGATESSQPKGAVLQIIVQGFFRVDKSLVRKAKVIVSSGVEEKLSYSENELSCTSNFNEVD